MPLTLTGHLHKIAETSQTDRKTGEIRPKYTAEVLDTRRGRTVVEGLTIEDTMVSEWKKALNQEISIAVRPYAMKNDDGSILSGLSLAEKGALPVIHKAKQAA